MSNRYEILDKVGEGGMATVYKAQDTLLDRIVALKVLKAEYADDEEFLEKFQNEAQAVAKLNSTHIISVYDVGKDEDISYIVMEFVEGKNLKELIRTNGKFSEKEALVIGRQIALSLDEAHKKKIIHRDIKSQNIMLTDKNTIKVGDFGIAKAVSSSTITAVGSIMGSVHYFSPEQARGGFVDARTDLYSLGIVLYELVTGRLPFDGDSPVNIALMHIQKNIEFLPEDEVSGLTKQLILKLTKKNQEERYRSAENVITDIDIIMTGGKVVNNKKRQEEEQYFIKNVPVAPVTPTKREVAAAGSTKKEKPVVVPPSKVPSNKKNDPKKKKKNTTNLLAILLALLVAILVLSFIFFNGNRRFADRNNVLVKVPNFAGMTIEAASSLAKEKNLTLVTDGTQETKDFQPGQIMAQDPSADTEVAKNSIVKVKIASDQNYAILPNYVGMDVTAAQTAIQKLGLTYVVAEEQSTKPTGEIISQNPAAGTKMQLGQSVNIVKSKNVNEIPVEVAFVIGATESQARNKLSVFNVQIKQAEDRSRAEGIVLDQEPDSGTSLKPGSTVILVINKYEEKLPPPESKPIESQPNVPVESKESVQPEQPQRDNNNAHPTESTTTGEEVTFNLSQVPRNTSYRIVSSEGTVIKNGKSDGSNLTIKFTGHSGDTRTYRVLNQEGVTVETKRVTF